MQYMFDENFPPPLAKSIGLLHARDFPYDRIETARAQGLGGVGDPHWIRELVLSGELWTVVTRDAMRRERNMVAGSGLTWFIFHPGWASLKFWDLSWRMVKAWPEVAAAGRRHPGSVFDVDLSGRIKRRE